MFTIFPKSGHYALKMAELPEGEGVSSLCEHGEVSARRVELGTVAMSELTS